MGAAEQVSVWIARARRAPTVLFPAICGQFLKWLDAHPLLGPDFRLIAVDDQFKQYLDEVDRSIRGGAEGRWLPYLTTNDDTYVSRCLSALKKIAEVAEGTDENFVKKLLRQIAYAITGEKTTQSQEDHRYLEVRDLLVESAFCRVAEHAQELLTTRATFAGLIGKYVQRSTRFRRARLRRIATREDSHEGRSSAELNLQVDLQEFLFDQGADFSIEEHTGGGYPDVILRTPDGRRWITDVKYINEAQNAVSCLARGGSQVARYCRDLRESIGYVLVVANIPEIIRIEGPLLSRIPTVTIGSAKILFETCDIFERRAASLEGRSQELRIDASRIAARVTELEGTTPGSGNPT